MIHFVESIQRLANQRAMLESMHPKSSMHRCTEKTTIALLHAIQTQTKLIRVTVATSNFISPQIASINVELICAAYSVLQTKPNHEIAKHALNNIRFSHVSHLVAPNAVAVSRNNCYIKKINALYNLSRSTMYLIFACASTTKLFRDNIPTTTKDS
jgi:hypothetical protein